MCLKCLSSFTLTVIIPILHCSQMLTRAKTQRFAVMSSPSAPSAPLRLLLWPRGAPLTSPQLLPAPRAPGHQAEPSSSQQQGHAASQACARVRALSGPSCNTHTRVVLFPLYLDHHRSREGPLSLNGEPLRFRLSRG